MRDRSVEISTAQDTLHCRPRLQPGQPCVECCRRPHARRQLIAEGRLQLSCRWPFGGIDASIARSQ